MKRLKWLYPGMLIKRWITLSVIGILMVSMGFVVTISERKTESRAIAGLIIVFGIVIMVFAMKRILKSFMTAIAPANKQETLVEKMYEKRILEKGPRIVVVGGGTGLSTLLEGLKIKTSNLTAIVTVADDGGSSGRLREEMDVLPPGDLRNCIVALADSEDILGPLFQFRFGAGTGLEGHNFGNLFITALSKVTGDFARAIKESSKVLAIRGSVLPATLDKVKLVALRENGTKIEGESKIKQGKGSPIKKMTLIPENCVATQEAVDDIKKADIIILGPGSLYTSVMPNLLIKGIKNALLKARGKKVYVCNVMTEPGETDDYSVSDHARSILKHTAPGVLDYCICNVKPIPGILNEKYEGKEQYPVAFGDKDEKWFKNEKIKLIKANIASTKEFVRHDSKKLTDAISEIIDE